MTRGEEASAAADRDSVQLVASLLNLERRRLKPGCDGDCLKAFDAVSRRVEMLAYIDNLFRAEFARDVISCVGATDAITTFLVDAYSLEVRPSHTHGTCMLTLPETRGIGLILNEVIDAYCRPNSNNCHPVMTITVISRPSLITIELDLSPASAEQLEISMLLISDLLDQHDAELTPAHIAGETKWQLRFPLGSKGRNA